MPATLPATRPPARRWGRLTPLRIAAIYAVVAAAWIYTSDHLVQAIAGGDAAVATQFQTAKGAVYVALTAWMLYLLATAAERAVRREQGVSQSVLAQLPEAVAVRDLHGRMAYINPAGARMLGRDAADIIGRLPGELAPPEIAERVLTDDARALAERAPVFTETTVGRGHEQRIFRTTRIALHDDEGVPLGLIALTRDVTAIVREEEALRARETGLAQREKLEALGRLAGGVAHDFNNLLTVISTATELAADALASGGDDALGAARADLDEVRRAAQRAGDLTRRLLAFARHHPATRDRVEVDSIAADMATLVRRTLRAGVSVTVERGDGPCTVEGSATALGQVVLNLVLNSADALPTGGVIVVGVQAVEEAGDDGVPRRWVALRVSDHGVGMDASTRERALEPFFTTKVTGAGTGLGLATADAIVREHGGRMRIESAPGQGTTVTVLLPAAAAAATTAPAARAHADAPRVTDAPVLLLVEDEASVRTLARRALVRAGFSVVEARHGADALRMVDGGALPRVVVTDVAMPEMNGVQLAERLRARDPALPVLFISGYTAGESLPAVQLGPGHSAFLQKPFSTDALVRAVVGLMEASTVRR